MRRLIAALHRAPAASVRVRRRPAMRRLRPALLWGAATLAVALMSGSAAWLWSSGRAANALDRAGAAFVEATTAAGLTLRDVYVTGRHRASRAAILKALAIESGAPLVTFDPAAARRRLEALGWVREATVERRFPKTIFVRLIERAPLALWQRKGEFEVVDGAGVVIDGARADGFAGLPVIVGDDAPRHAASLLAVLASEPALSTRVKAAVRVGGRRWNVRLDNGIDIQLPEEGVAAAWHRLAEFDRRHRLLARDIVAVDLRLPDRLVVRRAPAASVGKDKSA